MITRLTVQPSYAGGFSFAWEVAPEFIAPAPWTFRVQRGESHGGPWEDISPALINMYTWQSDERLVVPKDPVLYFRVQLTPVSGPAVYSPVIMPYGDLGRREFLIVQEIMRKELLQMEQMAGVPIVLWTKSIFGPKCTQCGDFVLGGSCDADCSDCLGTGRTPPYHGPYCSWGTFSTSDRKKGMQNDQTAVSEPYTVQLRMLGSPRVKKDDVIIDIRADKRYYVDRIQNLTEIRRIPVVQNVVVNEIPSSSAIYRLGQDA